VTLVVTKAVTTALQMEVIMNKAVTRTLKESRVDNSALINVNDTPAKVARPVHIHPLIAEGLRRNDLKNLVSDVVSIDEYNSKIDDSAIVMAFHVQDRNAAQDLNRFIQKSYVDLLDTDVSPAPDQKGFYLVFVELPLNTNIGEAIENITKDVGALADIDTWRMRLRSIKGTRPLNVKLVDRVLVKQLNDNLHEFFHMSDLSNVILEGSLVKLIGSNQVFQVEFVDFGPASRLYADRKLSERAVSFDTNSKLGARKAQLLLGRSLDVECLGEHLVVRSYNSSQILLCKLL
jgi:hypothetical protein